LARLVLEFSPTDCPGDGGKLLVQTNPLKQVHIADTSVSKLLTVEGLVLLHLLSGADGDVIAVCSLKNVIVCKIMAQPHGPVR
jgi:predicted membrane GTPase involved in stress response